MEKTILNSNLSESLKLKLTELFNSTNNYVLEHHQEAKEAEVIYTPVFIHSKGGEIIRIGLVNELYFENFDSEDSSEYELNEFNFFNENGIIEDDLMPMDLNIEKSLIYMPAIYIKQNEDSYDEVKMLNYKHFFVE